jgi:cobyric acid synthase CobQ/L-threonine-O-3-phosphate decarboxylase
MSSTVQRQGIVHGGDAAAAARDLGVHAAGCPRLDFSVNVNPLGTPAWVKGLLACSEELVGRYPEPGATALSAALATAHGVSADHIVAGNGSTEILSWIVQALRPAFPAWVSPAYAGYGEVCTAAGIHGAAVPAISALDAPRMDWNRLRNSDADLLFLASPNNPTGDVLDAGEVLAVAESNLRRTVVLDESFLDFLPDADSRTLIRPAMPPNLIVIKSLTKFFAIPGLRLGMACAAPDTVRRIEAARLPWSVNGPAQAVGARLYEDRDYIERSRETLPRWREAFAAQLAELPGLIVRPSKAPFLLCRLTPPWTASRLQAELLRRSILIRSCQNFEGLGDAYCRLAVRPKNEQDQLVAALRELLQGRNTNTATRRKPAIMVVGTTSHAGKSVVAAGLCRLFARRGLRDAPFKAQNMALNSFVTAEGGEMGRAQVTQARAARAEPHTDMNPVLLKPTGASGSQVIVNGRAIGTMSARDYYGRKAELRNLAHAAYDRLQERFDLLILEGAGSPAEINLREQDFVNLDMAEHAGARALLVADIDRGGVFASIFGTLALLPSSQRRLIGGVVINKFRGDASLLTPGIREIEAITGVPVLGVLPYLPDLQIEEEDSLGIEGRGAHAAAVLDIAVVRLPRISNYTDFLALERWNGVRVRYVTRPRELQGADLIILPGSKNTRGDLQFLHANGFTPRIRALHASGTPVFGICGGYQMMGRTVADPHGVEGEPGASGGLELLPVETTLEKEKELAQVSGTTTAGCVFAKSGTLFRGYEIHAGATTQPAGDSAPLRILERRGAACDESVGATVEGNGTYAFGAYVHGLFDEETVTRQFVQWLCRRKGLAPEQLDREAAPDPDAALDRVADMLETHLNVRLMEEWINAPA